MRIVLDGVFNHSGLKFAPFVDAMEKGEASPYCGWFCFDDKMPYGYHTFGDWRYMPKLTCKTRTARSISCPWDATGSKMPCGRLAAGCEPGGVAGFLAAVQNHDAQGQPRQPDGGGMLG